MNKIKVYSIANKEYEFWLFGNAKRAVIIDGFGVKENRLFCSVLFAMLKYTNLVIIARGEEELKLTRISFEAGYFFLTHSTSVSVCQEICVYN